MSINIALTGSDHALEHLEKSWMVQKNKEQDLELGTCIWLYL